MHRRAASGRDPRSLYEQRRAQTAIKRRNYIMDPAIAKQVLRLFTYGMYIVTTASEDGDVGAFTADWVMQVSFEPRMLAVSVEQDAHSFGVLRRSGVFAV